MASKPQVYLYNSHGHALSGNITRPLVEMIDAQAAASLSARGGHGYSTVNNFNYKNLVTFKTATTRVAGSEDKDGNHTSLASVCVEGLNILDVVTADRIVARVATHHPPGHPEPAISVHGTHFENLRIAGHPVAADVDHDLFVKYPTFASARKGLAKDPAFKKIALDPFETGKTLDVPEPEGILLCTCLKKPTDVPGTTRKGHCYSVPHFGTVCVGESYWQHQKRRLIMLRIELGSPVEGTIVALDTQDNGSQWPPP